MKIICTAKELIELINKETSVAATTDEIDTNSLAKHTFPLSCCENVNNLTR
ncbi:MAG: hypothetical protein HFJ48_07350 [Clostridia bacterium]|nr:hypothetical protein [Clostridia bacterium]